MATWLLFRTSVNFAPMRNIYLAQFVCLKTERTSVLKMWRQLFKMDLNTFIPSSPHPAVLCHTEWKRGRFMDFPCKAMEDFKLLGYPREVHQSHSWTNSHNDIHDNHSCHCAAANSVQADSAKTNLHHDPIFWFHPIWAMPTLNMDQF